MTAEGIGERKGERQPVLIPTIRTDGPPVESAFEQAVNRRIVEPRAVAEFGLPSFALRRYETQARNIRWDPP